MAEKRPFRTTARLTGQRDARLIIIAAEGTKTEKKYFEDLAIAYVNSKIHVEFLDRYDTKSDPGYVIAQLDKFKSVYRIRSRYDELWLVIDVDRWGGRKLSEVCRLAIQKHYELAVSNPCFELWLLLHRRSLDNYSVEELQKLLRNEKDGTTRTYISRELVSIIGKYNSDDLSTEDFIPYVKEAIDRAERVDRLEERWPNNLGSRVYQLALRIISQETGAP